MRRWSVSSLIRSVSTATWTSVLPVSVGLSPNLAVSSCLRSWVTVMRPVRLAEAARLLDVLLHLGDQRLGGVKPRRAPRTAQKVDPQLAPVELDVAIQQVSLDQHGQVGAERGAHADAHRRVGAAGARRVHPM